MARPSGVGGITAALVSALRADSAVTVEVPATRITNEVLPGTARPYLVVDVISETDDDTLSLGGVDAIASVLVVSDYRGPGEIGRIASAVRNALDGQTVTVAGFSAPADVTYQQAVGEYKEDVSGTIVRFRPLWFRVRAL